jgi:hypothetical protein
VVADFELLGADGDETRILRDRTSGYSVALAGHPSLVPVPDGPVSYDVVVKLADIEVEHGFRIDDVASPMSPQALAAAFATAYASSRAKSTPTIEGIQPAHRPDGAAGGARAQYRLRDQETDIERAWVATKPSPTGVWALYHTTRANLDRVNPMWWAHMLSTMNGQHRWSGHDAPRPAIWPASAFANPSAKIDLTAAARDEAVAKARDLAGMPPPSGLVTWLSQLAQSDDPPAEGLAPERIDAIHEQLGAKVPDGAPILARGLDQCRTALDLRAWAWQCVWALGNARR